MRRWIIRLLVALLTFTIGLVSVRFVSKRKVIHSSIRIETVKQPEATDSQSITFSGGIETSAFQAHYFSSDGGFLRYGCFERASPSVAARELHEYLTENHVVKRTAKLDDRGNRIGERLVLSPEPGPEPEAMIVWNEGSRFHIIRAPTVKHALLFESSRMWADQDNCVNVAALERQSH